MARESNALAGDMDVFFLCWRSPFRDLDLLFDVRDLPASKGKKLLFFGFLSDSVSTVPEGNFEDWRGGILSRMLWCLRVLFDVSLSLLVFLSFS